MIDSIKLQDSFHPSWYAGLLVKLVEQSVACSFLKGNQIFKTVVEKQCLFTTKCIVPGRQVSVENKIESRITSSPARLYEFELDKSILS